MQVILRKGGGKEGRKRKVKKKKKSKETKALSYERCAVRISE